MRIYYPFTTIAGIELFLDLTTYTDEPIINMKVENKMVEITISSNIYELGLGEYFLNKYCECSSLVIAELGETSTKGYLSQLTLKRKYAEMIEKLWDEHVLGGIY